MVLHPFTTYVLRKYYQVTGWNEDNFYGNLTRSSDAILDFNVPRGLKFSISKAPNTIFRTTYCMNALPSLNGSVGYMFSSCDLALRDAGTVRFKDVVDRFKVHELPRRPEGKPEEWLAGRRVDTRDYLLSGLMYIPSGRLDAFYTTRISPTMQASISCITEPQTNIAPGYDMNSSSGSALLRLQHDTGRWGTEYSWNSDGGMLGLCVLRNFGKMGATVDINEDAERRQANASVAGVKRVDEEEAMEGGLNGRVSVGAEFYVSAERSAGVSTGIRFTTLPESPSIIPSDSAQDVPSSRSPPSQPPTTITAVFSPITGHILAAYAARTSHDLALCSRFSFNIHSYESEWTMGAEWWMRRRKSAPESSNEGDHHLSPTQRTDDVVGVIKARLSTAADVAFMWEGRIHNALVSLGVKTNLSDRSKPITAMGLEVAYFSSEDT